MEKKPFEFPTYKEFSIPIFLYLGGRYGYNTKVKRHYALEFLTSLMEYQNDGWEPNREDPHGVSSTVDYDNERGGWSTAMSNQQLAPLFEFPWAGDDEDTDKDPAYRFLTYKGCGTDTITQLNILYNIK